MKSRGVAPRPKAPFATHSPNRPKPGSSPEDRLWKLLINELYIKMCSKCPMSQANGGLCPSSDDDIIRCLTDTIADVFKPTIEIEE